VRPEWVSYTSVAASRPLTEFTSQIAVATFAPTPAWLTKKVFAVGQGTAETAAQAGFTDVIQTGQTVDDMRAFLRTADFTSALYPSADEITADLTVDSPGRIRREIAYRMVPRDDLPQQLIAHIQKGTPIVAPMFSRRGTDIFADVLGKASLTAANAKITAVGISANVFAGHPGPWHGQTVAEEPTLGALAAKTGEVIESMSA
jgi:uroporphyrinogen-III synthase